MNQTMPPARARTRSIGTRPWGGRWVGVMVGVLGAGMVAPVALVGQADDSIVYVGGILPIGADSEAMAPDLETQVRRALDNLGAALRTAGADYRTVASVNLYLTDTRHFATVNRIYRTYFPTDPPTRATVQADLPHPDALLAVSAVAVRTGSDRRVVQPEGQVRPGLPYSWGVRSGHTLFIAGATARDPATYEPIPGGVGPQTTQVLENIGRVLHAEGFDYGDVTSCRVFLSDARQFGAMNRAYATYFPTDPPARATVRAALMNPAFGVEIQCVAARDDTRRVVRAAGTRPSRAPYSPAIHVADRLYLAGMLGRGPEGYGDIADQTHRTLDNLLATMQSADLGFANVVETTIFVTDIRHASRVVEIYRERMPATAPEPTVVGTALMSASAGVEISMIAVR